MFSKSCAAHQSLPLIVEVKMQLKYGADTKQNTPAGMTGEANDAVSTYSHEAPPLLDLPIKGIRAGLDTVAT